MNSWFVEKERDNTRIDKFLNEQMADISRSYIQKLIKDDLVTVDLRPVKANYKAQEGSLLPYPLLSPYNLL